MTITQTQIDDAMARYDGNVTTFPDDRTSLNRYSVIPKPNGKSVNSISGWDIDQVFHHMAIFKPKFSGGTNDKE